MRDREAVESLANLRAPWGEIDLLLNNAGLAPPTYAAAGHRLGRESSR